MSEEPLMYQRKQKKLTCTLKFIHDYQNDKLVSYSNKASKTVREFAFVK